MATRPPPTEWTATSRWVFYVLPDIGTPMMPPSSLAVSEQGIKSKTLHGG